MVDCTDSRLIWKSSGNIWVICNSFLRSQLLIINTTQQMIYTSYITLRWNIVAYTITRLDIDLYATHRNVYSLIGTALFWSVSICPTEIDSFHVFSSVLTILAHSCLLISKLLAKPNLKQPAYMSCQDESTNITMNTSFHH